MKQWRTYLSSAWYGKIQAEVFDRIEKYCMFVGYPRSGHSLIGSLLDAHPNMIIAHELDVLAYVESGYHRDQIFHLLLKNSEQFTASGRSYTGYSYRVPNQSQGRSRQIQVIGDKMGGRSSIRLLNDPGLLDRLRSTIGKKLRIIHVIRNPYDVIATMTRRNPQGVLDHVIETFFRMSRSNSMIKSRVGPDEMYDLRLEDFIEAPKAELERLCAFIGIDVDPSYLEDCASIVFKSPKKSRYDIAWTDDAIGQIQSRMAEFSFLTDYRFDEARKDSVTPQDSKICDEAANR